MTAVAFNHDETLQALAREAFAQRDAALARITRPSRSLDQTLDAQHVLVMAERLSLADLETLGEATALREAGLQAARGGDLERGFALVAEAREQYRDAPLCNEARLSAETFQTAAEAYVHYRMGDQAEADVLLLRAIETGYALTAGYGYDFDLRLVHLGRNIARVRAEAGRAEDALDLAALLVRVIEGESDRWPWPTLARAPGRLSGEAAWMAMDQVVAEIALALRSPGAAALHARAERDGWLDFNPSVLSFDRAYDFISAYRALAIGDDARFLRDAARFFAGGADKLPTSWRRMDADVQEIATKAALRTA
jgi:hypothetical protein